MLNSVLTPTAVLALQHKSCVSVAAGVSHTAVATSDGKLYTFGTGGFGQLGQGNCKSRSSHGAAAQARVTAATTWPHGRSQLRASGACIVLAGAVHTTVSTITGKLYTFGLGGY
jgi:alpha-tubulin suppressor-like RCC1 family protein